MLSLILAAALSLPQPTKPLGAKIYASAFRVLGLPTSVLHRLDCVPQIFDSKTGKDLPYGTMSCRSADSIRPDLFQAVTVDPKTYSAALVLLGFGSEPHRRLDCTPDPYCQVQELP